MQKHASPYFGALKYASKFMHNTTTTTLKKAGLWPKFKTRAHVQKVGLTYRSLALKFKTKNQARWWEKVISGISRRPTTCACVLFYDVGPNFLSHVSLLLLSNLDPLCSVAFG